MEPSVTLPQPVVLVGDLPHVTDAAAGGVSAVLSPHKSQKRAAPASSSGEIVDTGSPSKQICKLSLSVDDVGVIDGHTADSNNNVQLDFPAIDLIAKLLSGRYTILSAAERAVISNPAPLVATLWTWLKDTGFVASLKSAPPLDLTRNDKGFAEPFSVARGKLALHADGSGHFLTSVNFCALNLFDLSDKPSVSWTAIRALYLHFFSSGVVEFPGDFVLPVWLPRGLSHLSDSDQLPLESLHLLAAPEFAFAAVLSMYVHQHQGTQWERFLRSTIVHIYGAVANEKHWRLNKRFTQSFDVPIIAECTQLTALDQSDVVKVTIDHVKTVVNNGRKNVSHRQIIDHFTAVSTASNSKHPLTSEKYVRNLSTIAAGFDGDLQSREALTRMESRHGRHKDTLHMSPTKLALLPSLIPLQQRHCMPEIIATIDALCWRGQVVGGLISGVTTIGLSGKNKRSGAEPSAEDTGLIQILLGRLSIRDLLDARFGAKVDAKLRSIYSSITKWEQHFPADQTMVQAASSGVTLFSADVAFLNSLPSKDKLWKEFQHDLVDGEYNEKIALAISSSKCIEAMPLIQAIPDMLEAWNKLCAAFDEADKQASAVSASQSSPGVCHWSSSRCQALP